MNNISILVAEDDLELKKQLVEYLEMFFDTIYECENGKVALELYNQHKPNIIITDINMPEINGLKLIETIRIKDKETQIIILSAYTDINYMIHAVELNLVTYLIKPIESDKLKAAILKVIEQLKQEDSIYLNDGYIWKNSTSVLFLNTKQIKLTNYETLFLEALFKKVNKTVAYVDLHYYIYNDAEYSQAAIVSIVKRLKKKIPTGLVQSSYKEGYKIVV